MKNIRELFDEKGLLKKEVYANAVGVKKWINSYGNPTYIFVYGGEFYVLEDEYLTETLFKNGCQVVNRKQDLYK